jgi:hypothetical protein
MRKSFVVALAAVMVAALPSMAFAKKHKRVKHRVAAPVQMVDSNQGTARFISDGVQQFFLPITQTFGPRY